MRKFFLRTKKKKGFASLYVRISRRVKNMQIIINTDIQVDIPTWIRVSSSNEKWAKFTKTKDGSILMSKLSAINNMIDYLLWKGTTDKAIFCNAIQDIVYKEEDEKDNRRNSLTVEYMNTYPKESSKTYLMRDANICLTKIGKSKNPQQRERTLQAEKPTISLFAISDKDVEKELHQKYASKRIRGEWFSLSEDEINTILSEYEFHKVCM